MASKCSRILNRSSISSLKSAFKKSASSPTSPSASRSVPTSSFSQFSKPSSAPVRRFSLMRTPSELGCVQSMLPLHSAVATARMTSRLSSASRSCRALSQGTLCRTSPDL
ncbi:hypothetical protein M9H77_32906 [Catharanthus roseus]|uniref:Uncharacterized protein n=1 Tax=Catharanthus roseus TaxID=4058 RepID=A0ACC0A4I9_CATRO|nr:hypothetical protein M9H77_32906 [Catharanthus roseus]